MMESFHNGDDEKYSGRREQKAEDLMGLHISASTQLPVILLVTHNIANLLSYDFQTRTAQPKKLALAQN